MDYECEICNDKGVVPKDGGGFKTCACVVEKNLKRYIGPVYLKFDLNRALSQKNLMRNLFFEQKSRDYFGSVVKSYLAKAYLAGHRDEWYSVAGSDILEDWLEDGSHKDYYTVPFLILKLGDDYDNKSLGQMVLNVLQRRLENSKLITWIYTSPKVKPDSISRAYGIDVQELIEDKNNFKRVK